MIAIGDIHAKTIWKEIVKKHPDEQILFIGDCFDCFEKISTESQIINFLEIIELKKKYPETILLLGNHEYHYLAGTNCAYSGYQDNGAVAIQQVLEDNIHNLQIAHSHNNFLFTHAGVTKTWALKNLEVNNVDIATQINELFLANRLKFGYNREDTSGYGDHVCQSPLWVRPDSLKKDIIAGCIQVVGHTPTKKIILGNVINIDVLDKTKKYLKITDTAEIMSV